MKLTFNVTTEQAFSVLNSIVENARFMSNRETYTRLKNRERIEILNMVKDALPSIYPEAVNDAMSKTLEQLSNIARRIDREIEAISEENEEE